MRNTIVVQKSENRRKNELAFVGRDGAGQGHAWWVLVPGLIVERIWRAWAHRGHNETYKWGVSCGVGEVRQNSTKTNQDDKQLETIQIWSDYVSKYNIKFIVGLTSISIYWLIDTLWQLPWMPNLWLFSKYHPGLLKVPNVSTYHLPRGAFPHWVPVTWRCQRDSSRDSTQPVLTSWDDSELYYYFFNEV